MSFFLLLAELFARFFYVGLFSVGGGLATLPFLQNMGEVTGWFSASDVANMVAISESTPGPMGINMATYVGYLTAGIPGSIVAPLGEVAPAIIIITIVSKILIKFRDSKYVKNTFYGLRPASLGLIVSAFYTVCTLAFWKSDVFVSGAGIFSSINYVAVLLAVVIFALSSVFKKIHPVAWVGVAAVAGIVLKM